MRSILRTTIALSIGVAGIAGIGTAAAGAAVPSATTVAAPMLTAGPRVGDWHQHEYYCKNTLEAWGMQDRFKCVPENNGFVIRRR
ncbi:hypothetical protein AB0H76_02115 [Nocardia sp. NPDC050712]|uniref:hypothetical protein n=1 Tax=Nocardia sp. NPDC050712 TaxID=3155518 RepID=UPI0033D87E6C